MRKIKKEMMAGAFGLMVIGGTLLGTTHSTEAAEITALELTCGEVSTENALTISVKTDGPHEDEEKHHHRRPPAPPKDHDHHPEHEHPEHHHHDKD